MIPVAASQAQESGDAEVPENPERAAALASFEKDFEEFPKAFWYATDEWHKAQDLGGGVGEPTSFAKLHQVMDAAVKNVDDVVYAKFDLKDPDDPEQYWTFVFKQEAESRHWTAVSGLTKYALPGKRSARTRNLDMFKADSEGPSLQPFVQKAVRQMLDRTGPFAPEKKAAVEAPAYKPLTGEDLSGSGFHVAHRDHRFIICSRHQFDNDVPGQMLLGDLLADDERMHEVRIVRQIYYEEDVQVLSYDDDRLDKIPGLQWAPGHRSDVGDPVFLFGDEGPVEATVISATEMDTTVAPKAEFAPAGMSGSPVVSALTGKVIGVLLSADEPFNASWVSFQNLDFPEEIFREADPRSLPLAAAGDVHHGAVFGQTTEKVKQEILQAMEDKVIPLSFLHFKVGATQDELRKIRLAFPFADHAESLSEESRSHIEFLPPRYAIECVLVGTRQGVVTSISLDGRRSDKANGITYEDLDLIASFLTESLGAPDRLYKKTYAVQFGRSAEALLAEWARDQDVVALELSHSFRQRCSVKVTIRGEDAEPRSGSRKFTESDFKNPDGSPIRAMWCRSIVMAFFREAVMKPAAKP